MGNPRRQNSTTITVPAPDENSRQKRVSPRSKSQDTESQAPQTQAPQSQAANDKPGVFDVLRNTINKLKGENGQNKSGKPSSNDPQNASKVNDQNSDTFLRR